MPSEKLEFTGHGGDTLAARFDLPDGPVKAVALFAHCFTCSKDIPAARRIAARLAGLGIAVLRFDFTGLGHSQGEFANTHFSSNVDDLVAAARHRPSSEALPVWMGVLMSRLSVPSSIRSLRKGDCFSCDLETKVAGMPACSNVLRVPMVEKILNPIS